MKISAIKAQVKNADRVSVYVDDRYAFSLTHNQLLEQKIYAGLEIDESRFAALKKASDFGKMYERVVQYVMLRPRSRREVEQYCRRKKYDPQDCQVIIEKLMAMRYINDQSFAKSWVRSRAATKPVSKRRLRAELQQKGVGGQLQQEAMEEYDEAAALRQLITKKRRLLRYKNDPQKLIAYLARQGFLYDDIQRELKDSQD